MVDDEYDTRALVAVVLTQYGARVSTAASTAEVLEQLETAGAGGLPDVIVSDIGMPDEDDYTFVSRLRALEPAAGGTIPAVALTAYVRSEDRVRALKAGFQLHVSKPVDPAELVAVVAGLAGRAGKV